MKSDPVPPVIREDEDTQKAVQADLSFNVSTERSTESTDPQLSDQPGRSTASTEQPPSSPMMDLETDFPAGERMLYNFSTKSVEKWKADRLEMEKTHAGLAHRRFVRVSAESLGQMTSAPRQGVKRPREGFSGRKRVWDPQYLRLQAALWFSNKE